MDTYGLKVITHASAFFAPVLVPLVVWLLASDPDLKNNAIQALLFHIAMSILISIAWILSLVLIGIPFLIFFGIIAIYYPVKGIVFALKQKPFHYPIIGSLMKSR